MFVMFKKTLFMDILWVIKVFQKLDSGDVTSFIKYLENDLIRMIRLHSLDYVHCIQ